MSTETSAEVKRIRATLGTCLYLISYEFAEPFFHISHSSKGGIDQELSSLWLERDFEPQSAAWNASGRYRACATSACSLFALVLLYALDVTSI